MQHPGHSVTGLAAVLSARGVPGFPWLLMSSAILVLAAGALLLLRPTEGVMSLTVLLMIYFLADGLTSIMTRDRVPASTAGCVGLGHRGWPPRHRTCHIAAGRLARNGRLGHRAARRHQFDRK